MEKNFYSKLTLLNKRGKRLQKIMLALSDEELKEITPSPSFKTIEELKKRVFFFSMIFSTSMN